MSKDERSSDKQLGLAIVFGLFVVAGGLGMLFAPGEIIGAASFALAIVSGLALIGVFHVIEP